MIMNDLPRMQVLITTNEQHIEGELLLPENMRFSNSIPDNMLFYILNGGFQFITLKNCEVKDRKNLAFRPDKSPQLHVNISCIMTMQIIEILPDDYEYEDYYDEDEDDDEEAPQQHIPPRQKSRAARRR
ncbi:unknown [Fusobacterium sp. CAG:439]|nr:unknown [Fusobacterium sp. CAG:439]